MTFDVFDFTKIPHAILLENVSDDKAYSLARAIMCKGDNPPCETCADCIKSAAHSHADIRVYKKGENDLKYNIEFVRNLCADAYIMSNDGGRKVYVLIGADDLSVQCQNALLKTIEEPPEDVFFIFTCESKEKLLETIISRCTSFTFNEDAALLSEYFEKAVEIISSAVEPGELELLKKLAVFKKYDELKFLCDALLAVIRQLYLLRILPDETQHDERLDSIIKKISLPSIIRMTDAVRNFNERINSNGNITLITTVFCADLKQALFK